MLFATQYPRQLLRILLANGGWVDPSPQRFYRLFETTFMVRSRPGIAPSCLFLVDEGCHP
ncbi:MAG: hypothetical protein HXY43_12630 [Fischerella sp.]|uniref:hypothetical protein n=1 Tax=Fischerella sp. TaxID=1191 RepID=UPI0017B01B16|nr:hypothetical protein [Fischerella sp.]NWF60084.1 hypothetical protein [Fischerella sp.]